MAPLTSLWQSLVEWLGLAQWLGFARETEPEPAQAGSGTQDDDAGEARRKSVHDVTLEQLGIAHWTSHTLF